MLRTEFALLNQKYNNMERENVMLIQKIAESSLKQQELEDLLTDKEGKIEVMQQLRDTLAKENEEIKKIKDQVQRKMEDKLDELEKANNMIMRLTASGRKDLNCKEI